MFDFIGSSTEIYSAYGTGNSVYKLGKEAIRMVGEAFKDKGKQGIPNGSEHPEIPEYDFKAAGCVKPETEGSEGGRESLLEELARTGYTKPEFHEQLTQKVNATVKKHNTCSTYNTNPDEEDSLGKLEQCYQVIDDRIGIIEQLTAERIFLSNLPRKPDLSRANYVMDAGQILAGFVRYFAGKIRLAARGKKRTLDFILNTTVREIGNLQGWANQAIGYSNQIIDHLTAYQEKVIQQRMSEAGRDWEQQFEEAAKAKDLLDRVMRYKPGSSPVEYDQLSTAERNLSRNLQHLCAGLEDSEAILVQNNSSMETSNVLEKNLRKGMLDLENFSVLLGQYTLDTKHTSDAAELMRLMAESAAAIKIAGATITEVARMRRGEISSTTSQFNENIRAAKESITSQERDRYARSPSPDVTGVSYTGRRKEAIKLLSERGIMPAKAMYSYANERH